MDENETGQPEGEAGPMTESAAAALLQEFEFEQEEKPVLDTARTKSNEAEEAAAKAEAEAAGSEPEEDEAPAGEDAGVDDQGEPEEPAQAEDAVDDYVHGNAKTRLRDGTEVSVSELKKAYDEAKDFRRRQSEFDAQKREYETKATQIAEQEKLFSNTISQAINVLQQTLPAEPDESLFQTDPIAFFQQKHQRDAKLAEINRLTAAKNYADQEAQAKQAEEFKQYIAREQEQLFDRVPELRDEVKRNEFYRDYVATGKHYGFSDEELNGVNDHRLMLMARDAAAYRKLQGAKPKVAAKAAAAKPTAKVTRPGARVAPTTQASAKQKQLFQRFTKTRSIDDAGALLADFD